MTELAHLSKLEPAYSVIRKFDRDGRRGSYVLAAKLGIGRPAVTKWALSKQKGGTGGYIPPHYYTKIMSIARDLGIPLTPSELTGLTEFDRPPGVRRQSSRRSPLFSGTPELPLQPAE